MWYQCLLEAVYLQIIEDDTFTDWCISIIHGVCLWYMPAKSYRFREHLPQIMISTPNVHLRYYELQLWDNGSRHNEQSSLQRCNFSLSWRREMTNSNAVRLVTNDLYSPTRDQWSMRQKLSQSHLPRILIRIKRAIKKAFLPQQRTNNAWHWSSDARTGLATSLHCWFENKCKQHWWLWRTKLTCNHSIIGSLLGSLIVWSE